jgi:hypothetical protein
MARQIQIVFIDDIDGGEAAGTVRFALDRVEYEIDLNAENADALRAGLGKYINHARRVGGARRANGGSRRSASTIDSHAVRNWARLQGIEIKERGRVPANVVEQYRAATGQRGN